MQWNYYTPEFECDTVNREMLKYSPWSGHRFFIYDFIRALQPETIVELGSYYGCSAFAMAQAIKDGRFCSTLWAVDTWQGDDFTQSDYQQDIYSAFCEVRDTCYSDSYVKMLRTTFDEAVQSFAPGSIDVLHIDGSHHYKDVEHDFAHWKERLRPDGIVLFHDISEDKVYGNIMGSHYFWEDLKKAYPWTAEFPFSLGLGVLFLDESVYQTFKKQVDFGVYQACNNSEAIFLKDDLRKYYFKSADAQAYLGDLKGQVAVLNGHLKKYEQDVAGKDDYIRELEEKLRSQAGEAECFHTEIVRVKNDYERTFAEKNAYIGTLEEKSRGQTEEIERFQAEMARVKNDYERTIVEKDTYIRELERGRESAAKDAVAGEAKIKADYQKTIDEKDAYIETLKQEKDEINRELNRIISQKDELLHHLTEENERLAAGLAEAKESAQPEQLSQLTEEIAQIKADYQCTIDKKEQYISQLEEECSHFSQILEKQTAEIEKDYQKTIDGKESYIKELEAAQRESEKQRQTQSESYQKRLEETLSEMALHTGRLEEMSAAMLSLKDALAQSTVRCNELEMALQSSQFLNQSLAEEKDACRVQKEQLEAQLMKADEQYRNTWNYKMQHWMKKT